MVHRRTVSAVQCNLERVYGELHFRAVEAHRLRRGELEGQVSPCIGEFQFGSHDFRCFPGLDVELLSLGIRRDDPLPA